MSKIELPETDKEELEMYKADANMSAERFKIAIAEMEGFRKATSMIVSILADKLRSKY